MRMWMTPPEIMCRKHLLGEHVELHMLVGTLRKGISVSGFLENNLMEPAAIESRHEALVQEMTRRGYKHKSPLPHPETDSLSFDEFWTVVNSKDSLAELLRRCPECLALHQSKETQ